MSQLDKFAGKTNMVVVRYLIYDAVKYAGRVPGICSGLAAIATANLYSKTGSSCDKDKTLELINSCLERAGIFKGICSGLAAIAYSILAVTE